ncbi:MAG: protein translocase subunit SecD [bacterium]|nr:protein translocase subunit SecD [bacterium]
MTENTKKRAWFLAAIIAISFVCLAPTFFSDSLPEWWPGRKIRLGLDLKGGSYLVMGVETAEAVKSTLSNTALSLRSELRKEDYPVVKTRQTGDDLLQIILLNNRALEDVKSYVAKQYPELVFREVEDSGARVTLSYQIKADEALNIEKLAVDQAIETIRNRVDQYGVAEPTIQKSGANLIVVQLPDVTDIASVKKTIGSVAKLEFRLVATGKEIEEAVSLPHRDGSTVQVEDHPLMTGDAIKTANVDIDPQTNEIRVGLSLNSVGAKLFDRITADNVGRQLAIVLDGTIQSYPVIRDRISGGNATISGDFMMEEARTLAIVLRSGALPAPLTVEEERTVGASLGADAIQDGVFSFVVGAAVVLIFMAIYYSKAGVLAVFSLLLNIVLLLTLLSFLGATLTLPGIAGIVLTVGMAVDANIIIFERIREEMATGASAAACVEAGFAKAHWTIVDSNITTFLTGVILYGLGTGPIKGFAATLCLGIATSVFCALFVGHLGFQMFRMRNAKGELSV